MITAVKTACDTFLLTKRAKLLQTRESADARHSAGVHEKLFVNNAKVRVPVQPNRCAVVPIGTAIVAAARAVGPIKAVATTRA